LSDLPADLHERYQQLMHAQAPVQPALQAIEARLEDRLTNHDLAQLCHLSEDYFIRLFRASVGQSPTQYIQSQRVRRAAQRLLFSTESIEAIAAATGFGNRFYFSRVFARHLGVAPAAYRRMARI
jgi:transcriptional regulator GlxA family with amidase domain